MDSHNGCERDPALPDLQPPRMCQLCVAKNHGETDLEIESTEVLG